MTNFIMSGLYSHSELSSLYLESEETYFVLHTDIGDKKPF